MNSSQINQYFAGRYRRYNRRMTAPQAGRLRLVNASFISCLCALQRVVPRVYSRHAAFVHTDRASRHGMA
jgi:hypothetical protein